MAALLNPTGGATGDTTPLLQLNAPTGSTGEDLNGEEDTGVAPSGAAPGPPANSTLVKQLAALLNPTGGATGDTNPLLQLGSVIGAALAAAQSSSTTNLDATPASRVGNRIWNVHGWANCTIDDQLPPFWQDFRGLKTKAAQEDYIASSFFPALTALDPGLNHTILHKQLVDTLVQQNFAPRDSHPGLGPLAFLPRSQDELNRLDGTHGWHNDNPGVTYSMTYADLKRNRLPMPPAPSNINALLETLEKMSRVLQALFGTTCRLCAQLGKVTTALRTTQGYYSTPNMITTFKCHLAPAILYAVHIETQTFFNTVSNQASVERHAFPDCDLTSTAHNISRHISFFGYAEIPNTFYALDARPNHRPAASERYNPLLPPAPPSAPARPAQRPATTPNGVRTNTALNPALKTEIEKWKTTNNNAPIQIRPMLLEPIKHNSRQVCERCNLNYDTDCLRWALTGTCGGQCNKNHSTQATPDPVFLAILVDAISTMRPVQRQKL